jgi:hypothetical protein
VLREREREREREKKNRDKNEVKMAKLEPTGYPAAHTATHRV